MLCLLSHVFVVATVCWCCHLSLLLFLIDLPVFLFAVLLAGVVVLVVLQGCEKNKEIGVWRS